MTWQWYYANTWIECTPENQLKLSKREQEPSVEHVRLSNDVGEISGHPENDHMNFRLFGDDQDVRTFVRKGPKSGEAPIYAVIQRSLRTFLPYEAGRKLFRNGKTTTFDLSKAQFKRVPMQRDDTIEIPQKNWLGQ